MRTAQGAAQGQAQGQGRGQAQGAGRGTQPARDAQQQTTVGTASITGAVVTEGAGTPVRRARVTLSGGEIRTPRSVVTNDEGQFGFVALPAGRYTMTASKAGYVNITYGAKRPGRPGTPIQLADGQKLEKATISLPKGSVVTGIVVDENGEPSPGTQVRVMRYVMRTGEKTLEQSGQDQTDDRGIYRVYGLQPGEYLVSASPRNMNIGDMRQTVMAEIEAVMQQLGAAGVGPGAEGGRGGGGGGGRAFEPGALGQAVGGGGRGQALIDRATQLQQQLQQSEQEQPVAYAPVYYPGTTTPSAASSVTLGVGDERSGVDFQLQLVSTARVEGSVVSADGTMPPGTQITLVPQDQGGMPQIPGLNTSTSRSMQNGRFQFTGVAPGQYRLMARAVIRQPDPQAAARGGAAADAGGRGGRGGQGAIQQVLWASTDLNVSGQNITDIVIALQPGMSLTGRVSFEGTTIPPPTDLTRVRVNLATRGQQLFEGGAVPPAQVDVSGNFTINGVAPGRYSISGGAPGGGQGGGRQGGAAPAPGQGGAAAAQWVLKSAVAGGRDILDFPLVIEPNQEVGGILMTFTDRTQELSGTLQDATGRPTADFTIVVFPADNRYWQPQSRRIVSARPGTDGRFTFRNLPPGDYRLTAITDAEPGEWFNPEFLAQLVAPSIAISLAEGERKVQDIRVAAGR
ncbi:MAG TPA: carboxypeptidase-like regulatory domain-containing protein [Vicinamibacterales bacterium]|nr:carboxypeptidase-like regulatory domain-containing protein [Vicinamibacterales bacterium]